MEGVNHDEESVSDEIEVTKYGEDWVFPEVVLENSPLRLNGLTGEEELLYLRLTVNFVHSLGSLRDSSVVNIARACLLAQRYFMLHPFEYVAIENVEEDDNRKIECLAVAMAALHIIWRLEEYPIGASSIDKGFLTYYLMHIFGKKSEKIPKLSESTTFHDVEEHMSMPEVKIVYTASQHIEIRLMILMNGHCSLLLPHFIIFNFVGLFGISVFSNTLTWVCLFLQQAFYSRLYLKHSIVDIACSALYASRIDIRAFPSSLSHIVTEDIKPMEWYMLFGTSIETIQEIIGEVMALPREYQLVDAPPAQFYDPDARRRRKQHDRERKHTTGRKHRQPSHQNKFQPPVKQQRVMYPPPPGLPNHFRHAPPPPPQGMTPQYQPRVHMAPHMAQRPHHMAQGPLPHVVQQPPHIHHQAQHTQPPMLYTQQHQQFPPAYSRRY
ncbi:hypothetical protein PCE1_003762 [Barthelona sp. PCE]